MDGGAGKGNLRIGIDTGGTFTDIVSIDASTGAMNVTKVSSTPANPAIGLVQGIHDVLAKSGSDPADVSVICHGTTVATNALLQGQIEGLGLIVTKGFRHILEIARQAVPDGYGNSYFWVKPDRLVPLHHVGEVVGRLNFKGAELEALNEESVRGTARAMRKQGLRAIGVCLMHSYANSAHERRVGEIIADEYPEAVVSLSCDVLPEYREYERAVTTLVDAFVKPYMARYLGNVSEELGPILREPPFLVMQSSGGVISAEQVVEKPITTALSGPAAGALGAAMVSRVAGFSDVVTLDAGGTSTDICLIEGGDPHITTDASVGPFPVRLPMIDIRTVGTGGGSIAWITREGNLNVGPISAGAVPGPMCYPNGGDEPTITDANLALGRLPAELIGGGIVLDAERARSGIAALAKRLGQDMSAEELAAGIIEIANWNQANMIRQMTIQRGIDPRTFALLSFGGSGPAQSPAVMDLLDMDACIVPPNPGNLSAFGLLAVDWRSDHIVTRVVQEDEIDPAAVAQIYTQLEADARETLIRDGLDPSVHRYVREADVRYVGQSMEVRVTAPAGHFTADAARQLAEAFHASHERTFGYAYRGKQKIEIVNFCLSGFGTIERPSLPKLSTDTDDAEAARKPNRQVYFDGGYRDTPVYDRVRLPAGTRIEGPSVIEEFGSTTVVFPGQYATVDAHGIIVVRRTRDEIERIQ
ncbi:MAG: hydantoinase/oxoprolinase family protein [Proteobacteria bacterium]|nr:hydantoinase/oxoprolinase family protein [Pseudomonadota bacterium]